MSLKMKELDSYLNNRGYTLIKKDNDDKHPLPRFTIIKKSNQQVALILYGDFSGHLEVFAKIDKPIIAKILEFAFQSDPNVDDTVDFKFKATELDDKDLMQYLTKDVLKFTPDFKQTHKVASSKELNFVLNHLRRQASAYLTEQRKAKKANLKG